MPYIVLRPIGVPGRVYQPGEALDEALDTLRLIELGFVENRREEEEPKRPRRKTNAV
jgi:hypothetical protein